MGFIPYFPEHPILSLIAIFGIPFIVFIFVAGGRTSEK